MNSEIRYLVLGRISDLIGAIDYFSNTYDPAWCFRTLVSLEKAVMDNKFNDFSNPCPAMAGWIWNRAQNPASRYKEASRDRITGALALLDRDVKTLLRPVSKDCGAV